MSTEPMIHEEVSLPTQNGSLPVHYDIRCRDREGKQPVVLFIHGFKTFKDWGPFNLVADRFADAGFVVAKLSMSHSGVTEEEPNRISDLEAFKNDRLTTQMDDLQLFFEALQDSSQNPLWERCDLSKIFVVGHSRGGSQAILLAAQYPALVKGVVTWSAVASFDEIWDPISLWVWRTRGIFWEWDQWEHRYLPVPYELAEDYFANKERLDVLEEIKKFDAPLLIVHSLDDVIVPPTDALELAERHEQTECLLLHDAAHIFGMEHPWREPRLPIPLKPIVERTTNFLRRHAELHR